MRRDPGLTPWDWELTPPAARHLLLALRQQVRLLQLRSAAYAQQIAELRLQIAIVDDLRAEIAELRERLGRNSQNSSKPPSSDPPSYKAKPPVESLGRKRGAQPGHRGHSRRLKPEAEITRIVELRPADCARCGRRLRGDDPRPERRQLSELPEVRAEVIEYRRHALRCRGCGAENKADWPTGMPAGGFGPRAQATVGYLTGRLTRQPP